VKYIVVQYGCPNVANDLPKYHANRLAVLGRTWEQVHAFDDTSRYAMVIDPEPTSTILQRLLAHTIYNPSVAVAAEWRKVGKRSTTDIIALVEGVISLRRQNVEVFSWASSGLAVSRIGPGESGVLCDPDF